MLFVLFVLLFVIVFVVVPLGLPVVGGPADVTPRVAWRCACGTAGTSPQPGPCLLEVIGVPPLSGRLASSLVQLRALATDWA